MEKTKGKFIVIEGGDGAGKSTQMNMLRDLLGEENVILTREPGGTPYAEAIRDVALNHDLAKHAEGKTQFLLMWASRAEHMFNKVKPALAEGKLVVSDRFDSSTYAYNIYAQEEDSLKDYFWQTREFILKENTPDLYIYLDVSPEISKERTAGRGAENHFDERPQEFHLKVRDGYMKFLERVPHKVIDADRTPEEIFKDLVETIENI